MRGDASIQPYPEEQEAIENARRSCVAGIELKAGHQIVESDIVFLRPGTGVAPHDVDRLVGRTVPSTVPAGTTLSIFHVI